MSTALTCISSPRPKIDLILNRTDETGAVSPCLYLGDADAAKDSGLLKSLGISHVVTAAFGHDDPKDDVGARFPADFTYHEAKIPDSSELDLSPYFAPCADFIRNSLDAPQNRVFIHCMVGTSRSVSLLIYYMMRERHYTLRNALLHIMHQRSSNPDAPYTHPNRGFMTQLIAREKELSVTADGHSSLTLSSYMTELSTGKNISYGPVPEPKPRRHLAACSAGAGA